MRVFYAYLIFLLVITAVGVVLSIKRYKTYAIDQRIYCATHAVVGQFRRDGQVMYVYRDGSTGLKDDCAGK